MECVHSRDQRPYWSFETKGRFCIKIEFNSQKIGLLLQHGRCSFVLLLQHGYRDVMWTHSIQALFVVGVGLLYSPGGSSVWTLLVHPYCWTASCTRCVTTALGRCRLGFVVKRVMSTFESLYGDEFTFSTPLMKPNSRVPRLPPTQYHSFFRNYPLYSCVIERVLLSTELVGKIANVKRFKHWNAVFNKCGSCWKFTWIQFKECLRRQW